MSEEETFYRCLAESLSLVLCFWWNWFSLTVICLFSVAELGLNEDGAYWTMELSHQLLFL